MKQDESFCLGIQEINEQHEALVKLLGEIVEALNTSRSSKEIRLTFMRLVDTVRNHFHFEEALMRMYGFDGLEEHQRDHAAMLDEFERIAGHVLSASAEGEIMQALRDYFMRHMQQYDRSYAEYILHDAQIVVPRAVPVE